MNSEANEHLILNGSWENKNRSITAAAFTGLIVIGAVYFNVQSILTVILTSIYRAVYHIEIPGNYIDKINAVTIHLKTPILISLVVTQFIFMLTPVLWIVKRWHTPEVEKYIRLKLCSIKEIVLAVLITILLLPFCYYITNLLLNSLHIPDVFKKAGSQLFSANSGGQFIVMVFVVAVTPAICEEIFFRGYFQRTLERTLGMKSFILTGILFGLYHMQPLSLFTLSVLGILFSFFYYRSKSLLPSSAAHFTNNFIVVFLLYVQNESSSIRISFVEINDFVGIAITLILAAILLIVYWEITSDRHTANENS